MQELQMLGMTLLGLGAFLILNRFFRLSNGFAILLRDRDAHE